MDKNLPCNAEDMGLIFGLGRSYMLWGIYNYKGRGLECGYVSCVQRSQSRSLYQCAEWRGSNDSQELGDEWEQITQGFAA